MSFFEPWVAPNSKLFSYLTLVQLLHSLWGAAALLCGVANLSMSFELNGASLSDSRRLGFPELANTSILIDL